MEELRTNTNITPSMKVNLAQKVEHVATTKKGAFIYVGMGIIAEATTIFMSQTHEIPTLSFMTGIAVITWGIWRFQDKI